MSNCCKDCHFLAKTHLEEVFQGIERVSYFLSPSGALSSVMNQQQDQDDTKFVCHGCIGDDFLAKEVTERSHPRQCTYCHERRQAIPLGELADLIHEALQEHYELTPSEPEGIDYVLAKEGLWHRPGLPVEDLIGDMAGISSEIASDVTERLANLHDDPWAIVKDREIALYDDEALYEERGADDLAQV